MLLALTSGQKTGLVVMGAAFVAFALIASMLIPRYRPDFPGRHLGLFIAVAALFTAGMLAAVVFVAKEAGEEEAAAQTEATKPSTTEAAPTTETAPAPTEAQSGDAAAGKAIFEGSASCFTCHTLKAVNATGTVGPNLDQTKPSFDLIVDRVTNGKPGTAMTSFKSRLSEQQIQDVAAFVYESTQGS